MGNLDQRRPMMRKPPLPRKDSQTVRLGKKPLLPRSSLNLDQRRPMMRKPPPPRKDSLIHATQRPTKTAKSPSSDNLDQRRPMMRKPPLPRKDSQTVRLRKKP